MTHTLNRPTPGTALVHCIVGARPNFVKIAPIMSALQASPRLRGRLIHTGQHYDLRMSEAFFEDLAIPAPDRYLGVGSGSHAVQTARIMESYEALLLTDRPDLVLVVGDVNSTLACSLVAAKQLVPIAHVEAGLRSGDRTMPEEINRLVTDALASILLTTCAQADQNLLREGIPASKIHMTGNVMIDTLLRCLPLAETKQLPARLGLTPGAYAVATIHRPSNVDTADGLARMLTVLEGVGRSLPVILPVHPRTAGRFADLGFAERVKKCPGLRQVEPLRYLEFLDLMRQARLVLTDSGGIQEETSVLGIPCLTLRPNTERPITIEQGTNLLVGTDPAVVLQAAADVLASPVPPRAAKIKFWDGRAADRIVAVLESSMPVAGQPAG